MLAQVKKWGNSQGIRLPKELLAMAEITCDDYVEIELQDKNIVLKKAFRHRTLEERAAEYNGRLGPYDEFSWDEPVGRERW